MSRVQTFPLPTPSMWYGLSASLSKIALAVSSAGLPGFGTAGPFQSGLTSSSRNFCIGPARSGAFWRVPDPEMPSRNDAVAADQAWARSFWALFAARWSVSSCPMAWGTGPSPNTFREFQTMSDPVPFSAWAISPLAFGPPACSQLPSLQRSSRTTGSGMATFATSASASGRCQIRTFAIPPGR